MQLNYIWVHKENLIFHGKWTPSLEKLLTEAKEQGIQVRDVKEAGIGKDMITAQVASDSLVIADCEETLQWAKQRDMAVLGYEAYGQHLILGSVYMLVEAFDEIEISFLERVYQRYHKIPWIILETDRCVLREITLDDLDGLYQIYQPWEITQYMDGLKEDPREEREFFQAYIENMYGFYGYGIWAVIHKETGRLIGRAGLSHFEEADEIQLELGYMIALDYQKQGYATEVCQKILALAKAETEFPSVCCLIHKENQASIHLVKKLGFQFEKEVYKDNRILQKYTLILR